MASDYDWSLPAADSGGGWSDTSNYNFNDSGGGSSLDSGSSYMDNSGSFDFNDDEWYVDSTSSTDGTSVDTSIFDDLWGWVKSEQGTSVLGGAASAAFKLWQADQANKMRKELQQDSGPSDAELRDARVKTHNASINKPMNMGLVQYKR